MPTAPQSPAASAAPAGPRRRITDTVAAVDALTLSHTAHAGDRVCLRFATRAGLVVVTLPLASWLESKHAAADHNGNLWPKAGQREAAAAQFEADAAHIPARTVRAANAGSFAGAGLAEPAAPASRRRGGRRADPAAVERYRAAWRRYAADPSVSVKALAHSMDLSPVTLHVWFRRFRAEAGAPVLKPKGKL